MSYIQQFFTSRDNNANAETFVGQTGRLWWDPVTNQIYSSDGNTPGGIPLSGGGGGNGTPGGSNSQVQFNQAGSFGGSAFLTFSSVTGTLTTVAVSATGNITSNYFIGNGSQLTGLPATYSNADVATYLASGTDTLDIITTANVSGNYILGNGALLTGVATSVANINNGTSNVTVVSSGGNVAVGVGGTGNVAVFAASGEYITGVLSASGNVAGAYFIGNGSALTSITGANITGTVANATYAVSAGSAATITANAQPNITSVGILTSLSSSGNVVGANINTVGIVSAAGNVIGNYFVGNANVQFTSSTTPPATGNLIGAQWYNTATDTLYEYQSDGTTLYWVDITGPVIGSNGAVAGSAIINGTSNVTVTTSANTTVGVAGTTILTVASTGAIVAGNVSGNYFIGNGSLLTGIASSSYGNANVATFLAAFGSNVISTTGNVTGGNLLTSGVVEFAGGSRLRPIGANLDIVAGAGSYVNLITSDDSSYMGVDGSGGYVVAAGRSWSFDTAGALTLPGATAGENIATQSGYITVGNLLVGAGGSLFNSNNDTWALYGNLSDPGVSITIPSNADAANSVPLNITSFSNVEISSGGTWAFNNDGTMTFPNNIINSNTNPITLWSTDSSSLLWRSPTGGGPSVPVQTIVSAENGNATISVATGTLMIQSIKTWTFDSDGNTTFPDNTVQTTAYPGTSTSFSVSGNVTGGNVIGTTSVAIGGTGGDLTMTGGAITGVGNITSNGIMAINAPGGITTTQTSFDIVNATATTVNLGGSATAVNIGATTGTLTLNNPVVVGTQATQNVFHTTATAVNAFGAATAITMGATSGTLTLRNPTVVGTQTTQSLFNTVATTVNFAGAATTLNIGGAGNATFSANTLVRVANTSGTALSVAGNITGGNLTTTGAVYSNYNTNIANTGSFMAQGGNTKGGTGYLDFLVVQNTSGGATNPYKWLRVNSTGGLEIINSAYTSTVFSLTDSGNVNVSGQYQVSGKQAVNGPAFRAYIDGSQTISSGSQQKVTFGSETFDTNANFASSRFTPTVEGYYQLNATVRISGSSGLGEIMLTIWKNGSEYARGTNEQGTEQGNNFYSMQVSDLAYANGSTDYFEIYIQQTTGGNRDTTAGTNISYFSGAMVRGA
jgi:hypothetical protein